MRVGSVTVFVFVFLSAMVRAWTPAAETTAPGRAGAGPGSGAQKSEEANTGETKAADQPYPVSLKEKIRDFFGQDHSKDEIKGACSDSLYWCVPADEREKLRFVIATVPDPIHTHLSLFFDRAIDAIVAGIGTQEYLLDRSLMPWPYLGDSRTAEKREQDKVRESFPGLMIFRGDTMPALFVFVVGEAPTSGINQEQFHNAVKIVREIRAGAANPRQAGRPEFGILGPSFSGSLRSLSVILAADRHETAAYAGDATLPVYTTVMGTSSIQAFQRSAPPHVRIATFVQDAETVFKALREYVTNTLHHPAGDIAILSEEETAYGQSPAGGDYDVLNLSFPRGISQFRSEYSSEFQSKSTPSQDDSANPSVQAQRNLRLDLEVTGSDNDAVAPYAKSQIPLSQEGGMLAILTELRLRQPKFILLRASDPLDELFLARYLRDKFNQGRLVIPTPDLLFPRDEGGYLEGVLGLNTYPLSPGQANPRCTGGNGPLLFPSSSAAAMYNAAAMLVERIGLDQPANVVDPDGRTASKADLPPCRTFIKPGLSIPGISPNLWLTIVRGNTIRPIQILRVDGALPFFPASKTAGPAEGGQRASRIPATWWIPFAICLGLMAIHLGFSFSGGSLGQWRTAAQLNPAAGSLRRKARILWSGGMILAATYAVLAAANTPVRYQQSSALQLLLSCLLWLPLAAFTAMVAFDFAKNRSEPALSNLVVFGALSVLAISGLYTSDAQQKMVLWQQRTLDLTSGISPATPLVLLLVAFYIWFWHSLDAESLDRLAVSATAAENRSS